MKTYLIVTGVLFGLIAVAHVFEVIERRHVHHTDLLVFAVSVSLSVWAWRLVRRGAFES